MQRLLKNLAIMTYAVVAASHPAAAEAAENYHIFDINSLSLESDRSAHKASNGPNPGKKVDTSIFYLDANGVVLPTSAAAVENNIGYLKASPDDDERGSVDTLIRNSRENNNGYAPPTAPCQVSPVTADRILDIIERSARAHGVDPGFATAVAWAESRFDRVRNSSKGARGPMQLMPGTARELGLSDVCDPVANIDGGIRHLRALLDKFQNPLLAAAAYNAGAQAVRDHDGIPPYAETVSYLAEILNFQLGLRAPQGRTVPDKSARRSVDSGVIGGTSVGRFVGGVMKF
ncbi:lytic transglycosylase domain-containing protein [Rhizobium sp. SEMIA 4085]|uniref:Lytic transglycosylase-like protein n=1 Tax=Rhizobium gallicum bv. gallicum R602sp TaxID=1041138 RepID=A0A0B4XBL3_9HYPH|nr:MULTISPECIES: lytic transglycosylase domain-containing protein [Rhizobium]AJD44170.1 lytic transglycosylase-like protein [Rhizobium gallicum bv. gallicum R602sp]NNH32907.1 lytic transglycosylase domain-containing protein [Rhizobium sp. SEMIA 4085]